MLPNEFVFIGLIESELVQLYWRHGSEVDNWKREQVSNEHAI